MRDFPVGFAMSENGRIRQHLANYHDLLDREEARLRALADRLDGTRRAVVLARMEAVGAARKRVEETFAKHLPPAPSQAHQ